MASTDRKILNLKNDLLTLVKSGQQKKAEKIYAKCKDRSIPDADIWKIFASINSHTGNLIELTHCCKKILEITPQDPLASYNLAAALQNLGNLEAALEQYQYCLAIDPDNVNAHINSALIFYQQGRMSDALEHFQQSKHAINDTETKLTFIQTLLKTNNEYIALVEAKDLLSREPNNIKLLFLLAQYYYEHHNYPESEKYYLQVIALEPDNIQALNNLGRLYDVNGLYDKAIEKYAEALMLDKSISVIHNNIGKIYTKMASLQNAEAAFKEAISLDPDHPEAYFNLGKIFIEQKRTDEARKMLKEALNKDIKNRMEKPEEFILAVKYHLSSLDNPNKLNEDQKAFVADLFDGYADKFDNHLLNKLNYQTPNVIGELLLKHKIRNSKKTLDMGCGTGLCGKFLKEISDFLAGIDLSQKMIDKAKKLHCYDELIVGEVTEYLNTTEHTFDIAVAADVFVYIASLSEIFKASHNRLNTSGYFIFSTERLPDNYSDDYVLFDTGRYKHSTEYIESLASTFEFQIVDKVICNIRKEDNKNVEGCLYVLQA